MRGFVALALVVAAAQAASGIQERPTPSAARIDVIAADAQGRAVQNLNVEDFEIFEDGAPRQIESVQFVNEDGRQPASESAQPITSSAQEKAEALRDGSRLFAIFLDEYHVAAGPSVARAREALTAFVENHLGPRDLAIVVKPLDSLPNLRLTRDREAIQQAIATFDGRKGNYEPRTAFEKNFIAPTPPRIDFVRTQIVTSALNAIAVHLGALRGGRKTIIVVSEGFPIGPRRRENAALPSVDTVIRSANRSGASIYAIDPRVLVPVESGSVNGAQAADARSAADDIETLRALATETEGRAILTAADLGSGVDRIVSDASGYYVIAFQPAHGDDGGRFHPVDVRVARRDVTLRARNGYWSPLPDLTLTLRGPAAPLLPMRHTSALIRPWFGLTRAEEGKTRVQFVWEPAIRVPDNPLRVLVPSLVTLTVLKADGTSMFESVVRPVGQSGSGDQTASAEQAVFDLAPGRVRVQMSIEDETAKVIDSDVRDIVVNPLVGAVALGTVQVLRSRNAREYRALAGDPAATPVAAREFSRIERLLIRVPAWYAAQAAPVVTAKLASGFGKFMRELPVTAGPASDLHDIDLPLAGLAAGEYRVELTATSGGAKAQDSITFRVTP